LLLANLDQVTEDLAAGAIVVVTDVDIRIRLLPIPARAATHIRPCAQRHRSQAPGESTWAMRMSHSQRSSDDRPRLCGVRHLYSQTGRFYRPTTPSR
jgi:hypothetical protein